jgi:hypothetical protein
MTVDPRYRPAALALAATPSDAETRLSQLLQMAQPMHYLRHSGRGLAASASDANSTTTSRRSRCGVS